MKDNVPNIMDLDSLTPGSVWTRRNGKESRYLFTTNTALPASMAATHPQMAIYADENDNYFSVPVDDFISKRTFFNVDPGLETRLGNLLAFSAQDSDDGFDLLGDDTTLTIDVDSDDDLTVGSDESEEREQAPMPGYTQEQVDVMNATANAFPIEFSSNSVGSGLPEVLTPQKLCEMAECYQQEPLVSEGKMLHRLFFRAGNGITHDTLYACFSPKHVELNAVYTFKVHTPEGLLEVDWDAMLGIYPYVFQNVAMLQVMFTTGTELTYTQIAEQAEEPEVVFTAQAEGDQVVISAVPAPAATPAVVEVADELIIEAAPDEGFAVTVE